MRGVGPAPPGLYDYQEPDITMMLDDNETLRDPARLRVVPTKNNIVSLVATQNLRLLPSLISA